jgi:hypothetical protein
LTGEAASANYIAALRFLAELKIISENGRYSPPDFLMLMIHFCIGSKCHPTHIHVYQGWRKPLPVSKLPSFSLAFSWVGVQKEMLSLNFSRLSFRDSKGTELAHQGQPLCASAVY